MSPCGTARCPALSPQTLRTSEDTLSKHPQVFSRFRRFILYRTSSLHQCLPSNINLPLVFLLDASLRIRLQRTKLIDRQRCLRPCVAQTRRETTCVIKHMFSTLVSLSQCAENCLLPVSAATLVTSLERVPTDTKRGLNSPPSGEYCHPRIKSYHFLDYQHRKRSSCCESLRSVSEDSAKSNTKQRKKAEASPGSLTLQSHIQPWYQDGDDVS